MMDYRDEFDHHSPVGRTLRAAFKWATTYLSKIALILRDAPNGMLTFTQLMDRLMQLMSEDRQSLENNIRVCLSTQACFVKVPVTLTSKKNYWKLDCSQITAKMVRRHFNGLLQFFPELASTLERERLDRAAPSPQPAPQVRFAGPFSIEYLMRMGRPPSPPSGGSDPPAVAQPPSPATPQRDVVCYPARPLPSHASNCFCHFGPAGGSADHGLVADGAVGPAAWVPVRVGPPPPPYFAYYSPPTSTNMASHAWQ